MAKKKKGALTTAQRKRRRARNIFLLFVETIVIAVLAAALWFFVLPISSLGKVDIDRARIATEMNEGIADLDSLRDYRTIALFGVDSRNQQLGQGTLSDVIIIAAINTRSGEIRLCSVYRDTYLSIGKDSGGNDFFTKCNAAYSAGGPEKAITMLNKSLDLNITDFVTVGFEGLADTIDALGGIEVDVMEEAVHYTNLYQIGMSQEMGREPDPELTHGGMQTLTGKQATAYCRIRYIAGDDFARASHQRDVLMATFQKAKAASLPQLIRVAESVFPETYTSMSFADITGLLAKIGSFNIGGQAGFPQMDRLTAGLMGKQGSCVVPMDLVSNVSWLHEYLYNDPGYQPSAQVRTYSETIARHVAEYIH
ncbi:MAG: LCP family protein [Lachnospiraceae bacterium]|nr:LCP family protein [Lachnospiraceae bacterium]